MAIYTTYTHTKFHTAESSLRMWRLLRWSRNFPPFIDP